MKLIINIGWGPVCGEEYWGVYLCALDEKGAFKYSDPFVFDVDYGEGTRLPRRDELLDFIDEVKKKFPDATVEDGTGVLAK